MIVLSIEKDAIPKDYNFQLRIRAVGDPQPGGDDNVYVFERTITIGVKENTKSQTNLRNLAVVIGVLVIVAVLYTYRKRVG